MAFRTQSISASLLILGVAAAHAQQSKPADPPATIVQPGAPGQSSKTLSAKALRTAPPAPLDVDIAFMQGMIHHHAQAVEMVDLLRIRGQSKELMAFGEKIAISQTDEIQFMKQWLEEHGEPSTMGHGHMDHMDHMAGMKGMEPLDSMAGMPPMPGMLTPEQMKTLASARRAEFDRLFLTGMIQHHTGALTMVDDLFRNPAAGQDSVLFDFATDVTNTQSAEIKIMQKMLDKERK